MTPAGSTRTGPPPEGRAGDGGAARSDAAARSAADLVARGAERAGRAGTSRRIAPLMEGRAPCRLPRERHRPATERGAGPERPDDAPPVPPGRSGTAGGPVDGDGPGRDGASRTRSGTRHGPEDDRLGQVEDLADRVGAELAGLLPATGHGDAELGRGIAQLLAFLRKRLAGDYEVDEFGFDPELTGTVLLALLRPLYRRWFRVEVRGVENIPDTGGALVVSNHAGTIALDALMVQLAVHDEHPAHRNLRPLGADLVFSTPVLGHLARKGGATLATTADAELLLSRGEAVGVWPEGFKGVGKPFSERYKLQRFGRGGFVTAALRTRTPIVPCAVVGSEETYPMLGNLPALARLLGLPYLPLTPTWPWLGPLGMVPLPSKWLIEFSEPVRTEEFGHGAQEDPMLVFDLTDQVRQNIQQTLYTLLLHRRSVFF